MITATSEIQAQSGQETSSTGTIMLASGLRRAYGTYEALKGVDIAIGNGQFVSITGESGSGKTTLLSIIGAISAPDQGKLLIDDIDVYALHPERAADFRREYIGFVFQQFHLIPYLTALENTMLPLVTIKMSSADKHDMAMEALAKVGLGEKSSRLPSEMSGGEQQRVAVARALVNKPPIVLADEPTGNLDTKTGKGIFKLFEDLNSEGQTVIIVTHNPELASRTARTIRLKDGLLESDDNNR